MPKPYTIQQGDTLSAIASRSGTDVATLQKLNPSITDPNKIAAGASLSLPDAQPMAPSPTIPTAPAPTPTTPVPVVSSSDDIRNAEDQKKQEQLKKDQDQQAELERAKRQAELDKIKAEVTPTAPAPTAPNLEEQYKTALGEKDASGNSLQDYQTQLIENRKKRADIESSLNTFNATAAQGQPEAAFLAQKGEKERLAQQELDRLDREANIINQQVTNRSNVVSTLMTLKKEDYANSVAAYDKDFTRNLQIQNALETQRYREATIEDKAKDNARANLTMIQNEIKSGNLKYEDLDEGTKATIDSLEAQGGMQGITRMIMGNVKGSIVSTQERTDPNGGSYFDILSKAPDGSFKVTKIYRGQAKVTEAAPTGEEKNFKDDVTYYRNLVDGNKMDYSVAFQNIKRKYPYLSDPAIYAELGSTSPFEKKNDKNKK